MQKTSYKTTCEEFKSNPHRLAQKECEGNWAKKGYRNHPLTEEQKESNRLKSKIRCRIEHVFGEQKMRMGNEVLRSIGFARAKFWIEMRNLNGNISRYLTLRKLGRAN
ncbi:hypothetical protein FACS189454_00170 [Planctomycetales bacterium]|nr:hypothetical protein FACS189454_00170 [Planctomycetales bacterium]